MEIFKEIKVGGEKYTQCSICEQKFKYVGSSTTTMGNHLKRKHEDDLDKVQATGLEKHTPKITQFVTRTAEWKRGGKRAVEWKRKIVKFVVAQTNLCLWLKIHTLENYYQKSL